MMRTAAIAVVFLFATSGALAQESASLRQKDPKVEQELEQNIRRLSEAWAKRDVQPFRKLLTENPVVVDPMEGVVTGRDRIISEIEKHPCQVRSQSLANFRHHWVDQDAVLVTYDLNLDATCDGQQVPREWLSTDLWVHREGRWQATFHQESVKMSPEQQQKQQKP